MSRAKAEELLSHYFETALHGAGLPWGTDNDMEVGEIVGCIIGAAVAEAKAAVVVKPAKMDDGKWACPDCGSFDIEGSAWVHLNTGAQMGGDPPSGDYFCPACALTRDVRNPDDEAGIVSSACYIGASGCQLHVESYGKACPGGATFKNEAAT